MHPPPPERARSLHVLLATLLLSGGLGMAGCGGAAGGPSSPFLPADTVALSETDRDSALSVLTSMRRAAFDSAFARLSNYAFTRSVRTEQLSPAGSTTATRMHTVRFPAGGGPGTLRRRDSTGTFRRGGVLSSISGGGSPRARPENLSEQAFPDPPAFVAPRTREAYRYTVRAGSLRDGTRTRVVVAQAHREGTGRDQGVRFARLTLTHPGDALVGLTMVRAERALLFREDSRLTIRLRRAPDDGPWVPDTTRFRAVVDVPLRAPRQFHTVSTYSDYAR